MAIIPGQWKVFTLDSGPVVVRSTDGDTEYMVARCYGDGDGDQISTATLIAAAPELLEALNAAKGTIEYLLANSDNGPAENCIEIIAAAMAKAEGRADDQ